MSLPGIVDDSNKVHSGMIELNFDIGWCGCLAWLFVTHLFY